MGKTFCFTGPRASKLCGYNIDNYRDFVDELKEKIYGICKAETQNNRNEKITFISGGAQGFDQLAFWTVDSVKYHHPELNIENVIYVPFKGQSRVWGDDGIFGKKQYEVMLKKADRTVFLKNELTDRREIVKALTERNHAMVNDSDCVIALYNDDYKTARGSGTAECMRYASDTKKNMMTIRYDMDNGCLKIKEADSMTDSREEIMLDDSIPNEEMSMK
jgi:uncharacterized phage-like protein YoqJ